MNENDLKKSDIFLMKATIGALISFATALFLFVFLTVSSAENVEINEAMLQLTGIVVILSLSANLIAPKVQASIIKSQLPGLSTGLRIGLMARMAMAEAPALFGLFVVYISGGQPIYVWANLIPLLLLYVAGFSNFPTDERLAGIKMKYSNAL